MSQRRSLPRFFRKRMIVLLGLVVCLGCGGVDPNLPETAPVKGTVSYQGAPVPSGTITFYPDSGERPASGVIGDDGSYRLSTYSNGDGAVLGKHTIVVSSMKSTADVGTGTGLAEESAVPVKFSTRETTPLKLEVKQEDNDFQINLDE